MAFGVSDLIDNIQGSIQGLVDQFTGNSNDKAVPKYFQGEANYKGIQSQVNPGNWMKLPFPYTFSVVNLNNPNDNGGFGDFPLPLAPQNINQREEPAISVRPTQGGTTVNHGGNRYKTLTLQGTTGIAPFKGAGGADRSTGEAIFQPKQLKYKSGYEVFLHFRNWMRTYYEFKYKLNKSAQPYRLLFKNYKDGEFLVVELMSFEMDRQSARSFIYDYKVEFKVLSHFQFQTPGSSFLENLENNIQSAYDKVTEARGVFLRTQDIIRQVESTYDSVVVQPLRQVALAIKALKGIPTVAADMSTKAIQDTVSSAKALDISLNIQSLQAQNATTGTLDPRLAAIQLPSDLAAVIGNQGSAFLQTFGEGLMALDSSVFPPATLARSANELNDAQNLPRSFYTDTIDNLERVKQNAEDYFNLGSPTLNSLFGRTSTLNPSASKIVTNSEYDILSAFNSAITGIDLLLSTSDLFKATFDEKIQDIIQRFDGNITLFSSEACKQIVLPRGVSPEKLAQQELGDSSRWGEIIELNNLKPPYFTDDFTSTADGVLKFGDNILIPIPVQNGFSQIPEGAVNKLTADMSEMERSLGCDLKLDKNFDLSLTNSGDFELIAGAPNMAQAVLIKLSYKPGEVIRYPQLGAGIIPGRKFPDIVSIKDGIVNTLLQDNRIDAVQDLALLRDGSQLQISFNLKIKNVDIPIPVIIKA